MLRNLLLALVAAGSLACASRARATYVIDEGPPPARSEVVVYRPGHVWVQGHWVRRGDGYVWVAGHYERDRRDMVYVPGHWERRGYTHVWVEGRWRPRGRVMVRRGD